MKLSPAQKKSLVPVILFLANLFYLYLGGCIFRAVENQPREKPKAAAEIQELLDVLKESSYGQNYLPEDFDSKEFVDKLNEKDIANVDVNMEALRKQRIAAAKPKWSFSNSMFFATTVVTTIGYGNLAPTSTAGRMFCVVYALIGIPLTLMLLAVVSTVIVQKLNDACAWVVAYIRRNFYKGYEFEAASGEINAPVWLALPIIFFFLALMSSVYCALEGWDFGTSLYFIFITFTTIGFGDVVPTSRALTLIFQGIWINTTLLYVGLSIVSITINLCATGVARQMQKTGKYIKILEFFSSQEETQGDSESSTDLDSSVERVKRRGRDQESERFEMQKLEDEEGDQGIVVDDDESAAKLNITREASGRYYGSVHDE